MRNAIVSVLFLCLYTQNFAQDHFAEANHIRIAYQTFGSADRPAVILINGTASPLTDFPVSFCTQIADRGFFVIRFDNRDVGHSSHLDSLGQPDWKAIIPLVKTCDTTPLPYTLQDMGMDVIGLMDALKIKKAHLVGASMGGAIAQLIAIDHPSRVLSLASLSASSGNPDREPSDPKVFAIMSAPPPTSTSEDSISAYLVKINLALGSRDSKEDLRKSAMENIKRGWYPEGSARHAAAVIIGDYCDRRERLSRLKLPVIVILGDADPLVKPEAGLEVANTIPGAQTAIIKGMGHHLSKIFIRQISEAIIANASKAK